MPWLVWTVQKSSVAADSQGSRYCFQLSHVVEPLSPSQVDAKCPHLNLPMKKGKIENGQLSSRRGHFENALALLIPAPKASKRT